MSKNNTNASAGTNVRYEDNVKLMIDAQAAKASIFQAQGLFGRTGFSSSENGGAGRDRTDDLKLAKLPLSQLSYGP